MPFKKIFLAKVGICGWKNRMARIQRNTNARLITLAQVEAANIIWLASNWILVGLVNHQLYSAPSYGNVLNAAGNIHLDSKNVHIEYGTNAVLFCIVCMLLSKIQYKQFIDNDNINMLAPALTINDIYQHFNFWSKTRHYIFIWIHKYCSGSSP